MVGPIATNVQKHPNAIILRVARGFNYRGLPLGYLTQLEQRLADTELALFEALTTLRSLDHDGDLAKASLKPEVEAKQGKHARMEEWGRLPLREQSDTWRWWRAKNDEYISEQSPVGRRTEGVSSTLEDSQSAELGGSSGLRSRRNRTDPVTISAEASADQGSIISSSPRDSHARVLRNDDLGQAVLEHSLRSHGQRRLEHDVDSRLVIPRNQGESDTSHIGAETASTDRASILASTQPSLYF
ncbi:uncharacterized protein BO80DRAFT_450298 [Aspergillus ibericus CBS 121593]|uniref:Uncharacterized protein n=1 Tax=Aspergillus ibericus CBS 121593 TaxID=1448316 RepID=A0A395GKP6_9EURO|nr:hypothetical protein BO80DRAFT_450298 [Aspergillus ibericus CBS 121593]RAK95367.1 hypothetical protein BO80DRAFT_450298 [Aspergillus ibericus CBS 121593]